MKVPRQTRVDLSNNYRRVLLSNLLKECGKPAFIRAMNDARDKTWDVYSQYRDKVELNHECFEKHETDEHECSECSAPRRVLWVELDSDGARQYDEKWYCLDHVPTGESGVIVRIQEAWD